MEPHPEYYPEDNVLTPRDDDNQLEIRSRYTGPKNNMGDPDTTETDEIGVYIYPPNDDTYTGEFKNGVKHGHGVYKHSNGHVREGKFVNGVQVSGTLIHPEYTFQGTFVNEMEHTGTFAYKAGFVFEGTRESETKHVGRVIYPDGDVFFGTFISRDWKLNGDDAIMIVNSVPSKFTYKGQMQNGMMHGTGIMHIMGGPRKGEHYWARFDRDQEVKKSRVNIPKKGGTRNKRTRCRRKRLISSKRR